jgi:hypothetical protein
MRFLISLVVTALLVRHYYPVSVIAAALNRHPILVIGQLIFTYIIIELAIGFVEAMATHFLGD